jgi:hypothetical protein
MADAAETAPAGYLVVTIDTRLTWPHHDRPDQAGQIIGLLKDY